MTSLAENNPEARSVFRYSGNCGVGAQNTSLSTDGESEPLHPGGHMRRPALPRPTRTR